MALVTYLQFPGPGIYTLQYQATNLPNTIDIYCFGGGAGGQGCGLGGQGGGGGAAAITASVTPVAGVTYTVNVGSGGNGGYVVYGNRNGVWWVDRNQGATPGQYTMFSSPSGALCWAGGGGLASVNYLPGAGRVGGTLYYGGRGGVQGTKGLYDTFTGGGGAEGAKSTRGGNDAVTFTQGGTLNAPGSGGTGGWDGTLSGTNFNYGAVNAAAGNSCPAFGNNMSGAGGGGGGGRGNPATIIIGLPRTGVNTNLEPTTPDFLRQRGANGAPGWCTVVQNFA